MICPGNYRERHLLSPETNYKDCFWSHYLLRKFWLSVLAHRALSTAAQCCEDREDSGSKQQMGSMSQSLCDVFQTYTEPLAVATDGAPCGARMKI